MKSIKEVEGRRKKEEEPIHYRVPGVARQFCRCPPHMWCAIGCAAIPQTPTWWVPGCYAVDSVVVIHYLTYGRSHLPPTLWGCADSPHLPPFFLGNRFWFLFTHPTHTKYSSMLGRCANIPSLAFFRRDTIDIVWAATWYMRGQTRCHCARFSATLPGRLALPHPKA